LFFAETSITGSVYVDMKRSFVFPQPEKDEIQNFYQHKIAPHYRNVVQDTLGCGKFWALY
jgi:hypothetical protein